MDPTIKKSARSILAVFHAKRLGTGDFLNFSEFGKALRWEAGYVKHENQRLGLQYLVERGYVVETNTGLELTSKGGKFVQSM